MVTVTSLLHRGRVLALGAMMVAALGLVALTQARPASADIIINPTNPAFYKPDLKVESTSFVEVNYAVYMKIVVKNGGLGNAGAFTVAVRNSSNVTLQTFAVSGLTAGATTTRYHKLPGFSCGGTHQRKVMVDSGYTVSESNETNNTAMNTYIYPVC